MSEQQCPDCGRREAAGAYCTRCYRKTGPEDWRDLSDGRKQALREARTARINRARAEKGAK